MCKVLGVSRSGYYAWKDRPISKTQERFESLSIHVEHEFNLSDGIYGSPKIQKELEKKGILTTQKTVHKIMKQRKLKSKTVKKYKATTNSNHQLPVYDNLLNQNFHVTEIGKVWVTDITYIRTDEGWLYLASVMDLCSRKIIGFEMSDRMTKELCLTALKRALATHERAEDLIHHSDQGVQYCSKDYIALIMKHNITPSMSRKGNCYDNASIESFHSIIKKERIFHRRYKTRIEAKADIFQYIVSWYNSKRSHSALGYISPMEFEKNLKINAYIQ